VGAVPVVVAVGGDPGGGHGHQVCSEVGVVVLRRYSGGEGRAERAARTRHGAAPQAPWRLTGQARRACAGGSALPQLPRRAAAGGLGARRRGAVPAGRAGGDVRSFPQREEGTGQLPARPAARPAKCGIPSPQRPTFTPVSTTHTATEDASVRWAQAWVALIAFCAQHRAAAMGWEVGGTAA
jgi:hypothetical protein